MRPFYERSLEDRQALTSAAIRERRTLIERWSALEEAEAAHWSARSSLAAKLLQDQASVADFGCGTMNLRHHLRPDQRYVGVDVVARNGETLVCDLNLDTPPETGADAAALLGVLEYIFDPRGVLEHLSRRYHVLVASYCITDAEEPQSDRRQHAWVNDFSEKDMTELFEQSGWTLVESQAVDGLQKMWRLRSSSR